MKEGDLQRCVSDYLTYLMNQGKLYFDRLNSGEVIVVAGQSRRRVKLCREGTADFMVIQRQEYKWGATVRTIFLELKGDKGKQRPEQGAFQKLIEAQGAEYHIVRDIQQLEEILT